MPLNMKKPIWALCYLIDQDEWWPNEAPHKTRFFPDVHTYCFDNEQDAWDHRALMKNPEAYHIKKTYLNSEVTL